jgi:Xaa-Pro aminopeptidase
VTPGRYGERCDAARVLTSEAGVDALLVSNPPNVRYLTGFTGSSGILALTDTERVLFTDFRYREQAEAEVGQAFRVTIVERDAWQRAVTFLADGGVGRIGYAGNSVPRTESDRLAGLTRAEVLPTKGLVEGLRVRKDAAEIEAIRRAAALAEEALEATLTHVHAGMREVDVAARLEAEMRIRGSEWHPFPTIVASGPRAALPHAGTTDRVIAAGDFLLIDFGATVDGYCSDLTRTVVVGRVADNRQRAMYDLVLQAQRQALRHLRAGLTGGEADALARSLIESKGFGDAFGHSLGHGLGLESRGSPRPSPQCCRRVQW